jgi:D-alanyl-D-alanine carboxypeptidase
MTGAHTAIFFFLRKRRYLKRIAVLHDSLGIPGNYAATRLIPVQMEAGVLVSIGPDINQREQRLVPQAASAWQAMKESAFAEGVDLQMVSAYRSVEYQEGILRRKLEKGQAIEEILQVSAAPGYSEHHTGRAVDITTPDSPVLEEEFESSEAFSWLTESASGFGFQMSFPRDNPHGVAYEPWHWAWQKQ